MIDITYVVLSSHCSLSIEQPGILIDFLASMETKHLKSLGNSSFILIITSSIHSMVDGFKIMTLAKGMSSPFAMETSPYFSSTIGIIVVKCASPSSALMEIFLNTPFGLEHAKNSSIPYSLPRGLM